MKLLLVGCGNVGRELVRLLASGAGPAFSIVGICTRRRGALANPAGIEPTTIRPPGEGAPWAADHPDRCDLGSAAAVDQLDYDVLVELSILSIEGRGEPALGYVRRALQRDRHVVTANKGPVAFGGASLLRSAASAAGRLLFESTVLDGTPVFSLAGEGLRGCRVLRVEGILNATSNLVLDSLASGRDTESAVARARAEGFAEADPGHDLDGWDSAAKLAVLANALMGGSITPFDVDREGIGRLQPDDFTAARDSGRRWRLACSADAASGPVRATVAPRLVGPDDPLYSCGGADCMLTLNTDLMAPFTIRQHGARLRDTAYGVINDLLALASAV